MNMYTLAALLLIIGGLVHAIPQLYMTLTDMTGNTPLIQILVGTLSVIVGVMMVVRRNSPVI